MNITGLILITVWLLPGGISRAQAQTSAPPENQVVDSALITRLATEARENNPALRAAEARARAAALNVEAVRVWEDPTAIIGGSVYSDKGFKPNEEGDIAYGLEQKLPLWSRPKLAHRMAEAESSTKSAEAAFQARQLRDQVAQVLLSTALARRVVEIGEEDQIWIETMAAAAKHLYVAGTGSVADQLQLQNEAAERTDALITSRSRLAHQQFALNRLLNRPPDSKWPVLRLPPLAPAIPLSQKLVDLALKNEPKLRVIDEEIKRAAAGAELSRQSRLPDVSLGVEGRQFSGDGQFREGMFTLRFSLPWANAGRYRKDYQRERERQRASELDRADQALTVSEELHHLSVELEALEREARLQSGEIQERAAQIMASRTADWESGRGSLGEVIQARRTLLESKLDAARALAGEHQMLSEMGLWTGAENLEQLVALAGEPPLLPDHSGHESTH